MSKVEIKFKVTYLQSNLSQKESYPTLFCYLDSNFNRTRHKVLLGDEGNQQEVVVHGTGTPNIKSSLCFSTLSWRKNETNQDSFLNNGTAYITFGEIATKIVDGNYTNDIPLKLYTSNQYVKGVIRIDIKKSDFKVNIQPLLGINIFSNNKHDDNVGKAISQYIESLMNTANKIQDTFHGTSRMRVPYDYSESGIETTKTIPLPAVAYVMAEVPKANTYFWTNAFESIMKRDNLVPEQWHELNNAGKARATMLTVCYLTQYMDYTGDTIDTNVKNSGAVYNPSLVKPREDFSSNLEGVKGSDCEDDGSGILQTFNAYISHPFPLGKEYDIYREMQHICHQYIPPLSLDNVRGQQVSDKTENFGAHMNDNFIPIKTFQKWLNNTKEGRKVNQQLPWDHSNIDLEQTYPFLVGEGTGMYEPHGYENVLLPVMRYVYSDAPSLSPFKKPILHKKGEPGGFFVGSLEGYSDYFYRRANARVGMGFWYCTKNEQTGQLTRGAAYEDMMNERDDKIAIKVQPTPPRQVIEVIEEAISRRMPPDELVLTEGKKFKETNHYLDKIVKEINGLNRPIGSPHLYAPVYIRPHHMNEANTQAIIRDLKAKENVWKFSYTLEKITDEVWGFEARIYANIK